MTIDAKRRSIALIEGHSKALDAIRDEHISIALWQREPAIDLASVDMDEISDIRFISDIGALGGMLADALADAGYAEGRLRKALHDDIVSLASRFAGIMKSDAVEIRLEHITTNACKKFHSDYVRARLITTYSGQGTQWLDIDETADCDCGEPHNIQQMQTGDVALFKGRLWSSRAPAIHRSPPIEGTGEERLMLVINPA